jgi:hypothetical protein
MLGEHWHTGIHNLPFVGVRISVRQSHGKTKARRFCALSPHHPIMHAEQTHNVRGKWEFCRSRASSWLIFTLRDWRLALDGLSPRMSFECVELCLVPYRLHMRGSCKISHAPRRCVNFDSSATCMMLWSSSSVGRRCFVSRPSFPWRR